jgi:hypothetical protein
MTVSFTASEVLAKRIVDRLCRRPPYGQSWREFAVREISRALTAETARCRRESFAQGATFGQRNKAQSVGGVVVTAVGVERHSPRAGSSRSRQNG